MRKLKLQIQMTIDGFIAGPNGEMDFMVWNWDDELNHYVEEITKPVDCILLGRKLAEGFIPHWADVASNPDDPEFTTGKIFTDTNKVVFSRTRKKSVWDNTVLASGELVDEINALKSQYGGDIITYGGADFVSSLIKHNLIDEYHLFINPTALSAGMAIFNKMDHKLDLVLEESRAFPCGIALLKYRNPS